MNSNTQHFARQLVGQTNVVSSALAPQPCALPTFGRSAIHTSSSARAAAVGLPTLGETNMTFNGSRWAQGGADGMSVFDMKGAMETLQKGPEEIGGRRVHPAQLAHAARIARAQQQGLTLYGFKVFPDLTPGRAFMWGTILAVYAVGTASYVTARSCGVTSVGDLREKMQEAFAPYKASLQQHAAAAKCGFEVKERPAVFGDLSALGASVARTLSTKPEALAQKMSIAARSEDEMTLH